MVNTNSLYFLPSTCPPLFNSMFMPIFGVSCAAFAVAARSGIFSLAEELVLDHPFFAYIQQSEDPTIRRYFGGGGRVSSPEMILFFSSVLDPSNEAPFTLGRTASSSSRLHPHAFSVGASSVVLSLISIAAALFCVR